MMTNRIILDNFITKLDNNEKSNAKELRMSPKEVRDVHLALTKLLLENSELALQNIHLSSIGDISGVMDGGGF